MKPSPASLSILAFAAFASLLLQLLAFAALAYSSGLAAIVLVLCTPVLAALAAFKSSESPAAIAVALALPAALFSLWSSSVTESSNALSAVVWPAVILGGLGVLWLAARFGRYRKNSIHRRHNEA